MFEDDKGLVIPLNTAHTPHKPPFTYLMWILGLVRRHERETGAWPRGNSLAALAALPALAALSAITRPWCSRWGL